MTTQQAALLSVRDLSVEFTGARRGGPTVDRRPAAVAGASFDVHAGETLGLIGASGAGKTLTALALLRLLPSAARVGGGTVHWRGRDLLTLQRPEMRAVRGAEIGMIFQDPVTALHPTLRIDEQVAEALRTQSPQRTWREAIDRAHEVLEHLGVSRAQLRHAPYAHQWSGGMCQRAMLAMALVNRPALLIADEPTTSLDALSQAQVLRLFERIREEYAVAVLLISHDLSVIAEVADRVAVMHEGRVVEVGPTSQLFDHARHPQSQRLLAEASRPMARPTPAPVHLGATALVAERISVRYRPRGGLVLGRGAQRSDAVDAVRELTLTVAAGETLALVGESGAGKSSVARALLRLTDLAGGHVRLDGTDVATLRGVGLRQARAGLQLVFQNPYASLNPRRSVAESIAEPLHVHGRFRTEGAALVSEAIGLVGLSPGHGERLPQQLSGGERQRVSLARALVLRPRVIVLDEPVSSLDAPSRRSILELLLSLQARFGFGYLFISHDLDLVHRLAHRIAVMYRGSIVESGSADLVQRPLHPYTEALVAARPARHPRERGRLLSRVIPSAPASDAATAAGCAFRAHCARATDRCAAEEPALRELAAGRFVACHFPTDAQSVR